MMTKKTYRYKDCVVTREEVCSVGADWEERLAKGLPAGEKRQIVSVTREHDNFTEVLLPSDPLFQEAKNATLAREVFYHFFCDENGQQYAGHPDELCIRREIVVKQFPATAEWPVVGEHEDRFGCVLGNGVYLFPDFDFENPVFEAI